MAKKKQPRKITVKNPKIGTAYYFKFAGSVMFGPMVKECEGLSKTTGVRYIMLTSTENGDLTRYPVSIHDISLKKNELKYV